MMNPPAKSSSEILSELFGAFNAEPPKVFSKPSKKSKKDKHKKSKKSKKSKKKHRSKDKKHKRSRKESNSSESSSHSAETDVDESSKNLGVGNNFSDNLGIEQSAVSIEISLDGTVGIKGEDGSIRCIGDENKIHAVEENGKEKEKSVHDVFEDDLVKKDVDLGDKKGKIQIKNLKFSSVFQETIKAVEEKQKEEEQKRAEKAANQEEGEISDSSESHKSSYSNISDTNFDSSTGSRSHHRSKRESSGSYLKRKSSRRNLKDEGNSSRSRHKRTRHYSGDRHRDRSPLRDYHKNKYSKHRDLDSRGRRSRSRSSHRSSERRRSRSRSSHKLRSGSEIRSKSREKGRSKSSENSQSKIDKEKLLAIARKNALKLIDAGVVPGNEKVTSIKAGGRTVNELTEYCKKLANKEDLADDVSDIDSNSSDDEEKPFHHPFTVRDRPNSIVMNIKNAIPLPVKSLQEKAAEQSKQLRLQFPVSSGSTHRRTENEWVPVTKEETVASKPSTKAAPQIETVTTTVTQAIMPPPPTPYFDLSSVPPPEPVSKPVFPIIQPSPTPPKLDISMIVSKRLDAMRKLQENPHDMKAQITLQSVSKEMQLWAESTKETGAFTGSTGAKILTPAELSSGTQAWAKKDQLVSATPVKSGMGMALLQKMGWQPGEGLGKNKEGTLEPLRLEVKLDKKGLLASDETRMFGKKGGGGAGSAGVQAGPPLPTVKTLDGKHPVSLLNEFCNKRRWGVPQFELCFECGPDHKKNFLFKVKVNGVEYTPSVASTNKKQAKAEAAAICLRALGVISS